MKNVISVSVEADKLEWVDKTLATEWEKRFGFKPSRSMLIQELLEAAQASMQAGTLFQAAAQESK